MNEIVAIYVRLSREDEDKIDGNTESRSIENQMEILTNYVIDNNMKLYEVYVDDGYTGANQNRPGLQKLLNDMRNKKFNTLLIKDISRLGRVMHQVGELIEIIFPKNHIRVISLNDNYDSSTYTGNDSIVLKNFLNAYYLKDFKRKCHYSLNRRANSIHLNYYPKYGYRFDEKRNEVIDEYSSEIVKRVFNYIIEGKTTIKIANILNEEGVLTKSRYAVEVLGMKPLNKQNAIKWNGDKIWSIVRDYEYCGHSLNLLKRKEGPILVKNTHLAIIDEETFAKANAILDSRKPKRYNDKNLRKIIFDETGHHLAYYHAKNSESDVYFSKRTKVSIRANKLEDYLYDKCYELINECLNNTASVRDIIKRRIFKNCLDDKSKITDALKKYNEDYSKIFEKYLLKKIDETTFKTQTDILKEKITALENDLNTFEIKQTQYELLNKKLDTFLLEIKNLPDEKIDVIEKVITKADIKKNENNEIELSIDFKFSIVKEELK